jgi:hypothetical protein
MLLLLAFVVILTWLVAELRTINFWKVKSSDAFGYTQQELVELGELQREEQVVSGNFARATNKVASLEKLGQGVRKNRNGNFDGRSKLGKKLKRELPRARALAFQHQNQLNEIRDQLDLIDELPKTRAAVWVRGESLRLANRIIVPVFAAGLVFSAVSGFSVADYWIVVASGWLALLYFLRKVQLASLNTKLGIQT